MATYKVRLKEGDKIVERDVEADIMSPGAQWLVLHRQEAGSTRPVAAFRTDEVISAERTD